MASRAETSFGALKTVLTFPANSVKALSANISEMGFFLIFDV